jgi:hypothetical protein
MKKAVLLCGYMLSSINLSFFEETFCLSLTSVVQFFVKVLSINTTNFRTFPRDYNASKPKSNYVRVVDNLVLNLIF